MGSYSPTAHLLLRFPAVQTPPEKKRLSAKTIPKSLPARILRRRRTLSAPSRPRLPRLPRKEPQPPSTALLPRKNEASRRVFSDWRRKNSLVSTSPVRARASRAAGSTDEFSLRPPRDSPRILLLFSDAFVSKAIRHSVEKVTAWIGAGGRGMKRGELQVWGCEEKNIRDGRPFRSVPVACPNLIYTGFMLLFPGLDTVEALQGSHKGLQIEEKEIRLCLWTTVDLGRVEH
ncbi:hypothetical protein SRHO_G00039450 [Serrasalmus rhombeus]